MKAEHVAVFGGDHIYKFAINQMEDYHLETDPDLTVAAFPVPLEEAHQSGVIRDANNRIIGFQEKPTNPAPMPSDPTKALVSMGNFFISSKPKLWKKLHRGCLQRRFQT